MRSTKFFVATAVLLASVSTLSAQDKSGKKKGGGLPPMIKMTVADFADGGNVPSKYSCAGPSPAITWSGAPESTQSYVLILHDPDPVIGGSSSDVLHWGIFDIPGDAKGLQEGVPAGDQANGAKQIENIRRANAYFGPCAPPGHGDHHYMFELYALNAKLGLPASTSRADLLAAMNGKVAAKGIYIGIFGQK